MARNDIPDVFPSEGFAPKGPRRGPSRPTVQGFPIHIAPKALFAAFAFIFVVGFVALLALTGRLGLITIDPEQVALKVNYATGSQTVINQPGYQIYLPFIEQVYPLDRRILNFEMRGDRFAGNSLVPKLTVRANDGSNFRFESVEIQYALIPSAVATVVADSGPGGGFKNEWIKAFTRSILRDEFGRYTAEQIADAATLQNAFSSAKERLGTALEPFGLRILDMPQQRPNFDPEYESAIEDRKVADQSVERLIAMEDQLRRERNQRLAGVERLKSIELESLRGELDRERLGAERQAIEQRRSSDAYALERVAEGSAQQAQSIARARGLTAQYTMEAEGVQARANALAARGEIVVREAIIQKLARIKFTLLPYSRDSEPKRLEHSGLAGDTNRAAATGGN